MLYIKRDIFNMDSVKTKTWEEGGCRRWVNTVFPVPWDVWLLWMTGSLISPPALFHPSLRSLSPPPPPLITPSPRAFLVSVLVNLCRGLSSDHAAVSTTTTPFDWQVETGMSPVGGEFWWTLNSSSSQARHIRLRNWIHVQIWGSFYFFTLIS